MVQSDHSMHEPEALGRAERPSLRQHQVVNIFQANSGDFPENIHGMQDFLQIHQSNFPRSFLRFSSSLLLDNRLERRRRGAMTASGVEIDKMYPFHNFSHKCFIAASSGCYARGLKV